MTALTVPSSEAARIEAAASKRPLFFQKRFLPMWSAFSLGAFADNMLRQALIIGISFGAIVIPGFASGDTAVPIVGSFLGISMLAFSPLAGQFADKYETAFMARLTKFIEMLIMATAAFAFFIDNGLLLVICMFAMGAQSAFFSPVRIGSMPKYYAATELIRANAFFNAGLYVSIILGLFFGGMLIEQPAGGEKVAGFLLVASVLGWLSVRSAPKAAATAPDIKIDWNIFRQGTQIVGFALKAPGVARPMMGLGLFYYISTLVTVLVPLYARDALGASGAVATAIMGLFAIGAGLGAVAASMLSKGRSGLGFSSMGIIAASVLTIIIYFLTSAVAETGAATVGALFGSTSGIMLCLAFSLTSAAMGIYIVPLQAAMQRRAPAEKRARIMAASNMTNAAAAILGSNTVLLVSSKTLTALNTFIIVAVLQSAIALYMYLRRRSVKPGLYDEMLESASS